MAKSVCPDYAEELRAQIEAWQRKPGLRAIYHHWYERIVAELAPLTPTVEIGSGCGNFKQFYPEAVATDVIRAGGWIDEIVDARYLPYPAESVGNFVLIDCLHHLPRPLRFLRSALAALRPAGRIVLFEPAATPWARLVWRTCHHEPVNLVQDFFAEDALPEPDNAGFTYANMGTAQALFVRQRERSLQHLAEARLAKVEFSDVFVYPASGGFSYYGLLRGNWLERLHRWEAALLPAGLAPWVGLRLLVVLEKRPEGSTDQAQALDDE